MRLVENFNQNWLFIPQHIELEAGDSEFEAVTLPHTNKLFPTRYVNNLEYQFVSTYRKRFTVSDGISGQRVFIDFDGVMLQCQVYLNDVFLGQHQGGYIPFSFDVTDSLVEGENVLTVYVDSTEDKLVPPYGGRVDYLTFGGIYRDVYLRLVDSVHIQTIFAKPQNVLATPSLDCDIQLSEFAENLSLEAVLQTLQGDEIARVSQPVHSAQVKVSFGDLDEIVLWTLENPQLYALSVTLSHQETPSDQVSVRVGFRSAEFSKDGNFYLNGKPLKLFGLNRHQTYPYLGAAAPARLQAQDADILKYELGCNIVRTSHYPQSPHFLNRCDEIGLLVFEEIAGWQHIGDPTWRGLILQDVCAMLERDRNHPSIILWGVRVNESPDCDELYLQTNELAHQLDPTRQTGGVRVFIESHFLEDVFTLNDFPDGIQAPIHQPHLITEFVGHMFPTKTWDQEERRIEHALRHAEKHNLHMGRADVAGGIAWCAFDYHTHHEFGSGDRICHHGVMDMFRLPKIAAYFYRSQKSPQDEIVLQAATNWTMGDRSGGGNNPLIVFSNCDSVEVQIGEVFMGRFLPDVEIFPNLPYPPFIMRWPEPYDPWGTEFHDLIVRGYMGDEQVAEQHIAADHIPAEIRLRADATILQADGMDMTRVVVEVVDAYGNVLPYQQRIVTFALEGDADFIGENPLVLLGGQGAFYVKACHSQSIVSIQAQTIGLAAKSLTLQINS